jgi:hypothetical protein
LQRSHNDDTSKNEELTLGAINNNLKISVLFNANSKAGKRTLEMTARSASLDYINNAEPNNYKFALNVEYIKKWNPLKTILFWVLIIILGLILTWIIFIRPTFFPVFKIRELRIEYYSVGGELIPPYRRVKLKGCYKVICCNKKRKQSLISRLFTGKIVFVTDDFWEMEICLNPKFTSKSMIKIVHNPYDSFVRTINKGTPTEFPNFNNEKVIFNF